MKIRRRIIPAGRRLSSQPPSDTAVMNSLAGAVSELMELLCGMFRYGGRRTHSLSALLLASMAICHLSQALAEDVDVQTELIAEVREPVGQPPDRLTYRYVPATVLAQGQVVFYTLRITNPTPVFARDVLVTQRIPANTTYVLGSAAGPGADVSFSIDGGQTFASATALVTTQDGKTRPIAAEQYTHIRWQLRNPLAPGAIALARFRALFR